MLKIAPWFHIGFWPFLLTLHPVSRPPKSPCLVCNGKAVPVPLCILLRLSVYKLHNAFVMCEKNVWQQGLDLDHGLKYMV